MSPLRRLQHQEMGKLRMRVFARDEFRCLARSIDPKHRCAGPFGPVEPGSLEYVNALTLEHVRLQPGGARRDDERFCVTLCHKANVEHWGSTTLHRAALNALLDKLYPDRSESLAPVERGGVT